MFHVSSSLATPTHPVPTIHVFELYQLLAYTFGERPIQSFQNYGGKTHVSMVRVAVGGELYQQHKTLVQMVWGR